MVPFGLRILQAQSAHFLGDSTHALNALLLLASRCSAAAAAARAQEPPAGPLPNSLALGVNGRAVAMALANLYVLRGEFQLAIAELEGQLALAPPVPPAVAAGGAGDAADGGSGADAPPDVSSEPLSLLGRLHLQARAGHRSSPLQASGPARTGAPTPSRRPHPLAASAPPASPATS